MATFSLEDQPEVFFTSTETSRSIRRLLDAGRLRHVGGRLYTRNLDDPFEEVLRRRVWDVAAGHFPGAVIVDRTAFEMRPSGDEGSVFLAGRTARVIRLPGLVLNCRRGAGPVPGDAPFIGGLHLSSWPRRFLENMRPSRARTGARRTLTRAELEDHLRELLDRHGEDELHRLRDAAKSIAADLDADDQLEQLHELIGALLGSGDGALSTASARADAAGRGWDERRLVLFDALLAELHRRIPVQRPERAGHTGSSFAFYEAYFSNFIEGTEFTIDEARDIVFNGVIPEHRPADAHDVKGTFDVVSDSARRAQIPDSAEDLDAIIRALHAQIMAGRPDLGPGVFKSQPNRAGSTEFVAPRLVHGTLHRGWERYATLPRGMPRALYALFLIAEVHPFADGNGRVARALANAELSAAGQQRVIVATVLRDDYLQALRALSRDARGEPLLRVIDRAQQWSHEVDWSAVDAARADLERTNALLPSAEADELGVILRLPSELA